MTTPTREFERALGDAAMAATELHGTLPGIVLACRRAQRNAGLPDAPQRMDLANLDITKAKQLCAAVQQARDAMKAVAEALKAVPA